MSDVRLPVIGQTEISYRDNDNTSKRARELIRQAAEELKPYNGEHIETFVFHFFGSRSLMTGTNSVDLMTYAVLSKDLSGKEHELSGDLRQAFLKDAQNRLLELLGAKKVEVKPKTIQQILDEGGTPDEAS